MLVSCAGTTEDDAGTEIVSYKMMLSRNLLNLNKISVGMTKSQVMGIMGKHVAKTKNRSSRTPTWSNHSQSVKRSTKFCTT